MWQVKQEFCFPKNRLNLLMNCSAIVRSPMDNSIELFVKTGGHINQVIDVSRFIAGPGVNEKMKWSVVIRNNGIEKVISTAQVAQPAFVDSQRARYSVPACRIKVVCVDGGPHQTHSASTIGNCKPSPVALMGQNRRPCRQR